MARYIGAVCKLCRREGGKLYLKGERCFSEKCAVGRRPYPPGQHGQARIKLSEYGLRLREKQKMRRIYGLLERQFAGYYVQATHLKGRTGEEMLGLIERRLDNVVLRMGLASSRAQSRQLVRHKHVRVNGKFVNIPSFQVNPNDKIEIDEKSRKIPFIAASLAAAANRQQASWLEVDKDNFTGTFKGMPVRDEMNEPSVREQYVVEYYSR
jgi:small subunit ribosomal protein S4